VDAVKSHFNTREGHHTPNQGGLNAMATNVFVINLNGHALMPCHPAKARKLLRAGKARVIARCPFTIKLLWDCEEQVQEVALGLDKGSHYTGFCCTGKGQIPLSGVIQHRQDVKDKMVNRCSNRRNRRKRKWYRPARFSNRGSSKRSGRLPPSIKTNVEEVIRVARQIPPPISKITIEDVQVDIARLNDSTLAGNRYQDPARLDENLRMACLMRDGYTCQQCGKQKVRLEAHHLIFKERGGQAALSRLFGYQTAAMRKARDLPKAHDADALCLATYETGETVAYHREHFYMVSFRPRRTRRQYYDLPRKGQGRVRYQVNDELNGFRKGDIVRVKGVYTKQINSIYSDGYLAFKRVKGEPNKARPQDCRLLERGRTVMWEKVS
jgi:hypothetical protein